ncbi:MAG TPA: helix-turn-helix transcriptional regulator [Xanthobacteraceae bacterium]
MKADAVTGRRISAVDVHVGRRVRAARLLRGISQEKLAAAVGVSFQQIQKYENGSNRIGTGRLHAIAKLLDLSVTYFFEGIDKIPPKLARDAGMDAITEALSTKEGVRIALALSRMHPEIRRRLADLLEAITEHESWTFRSLSNV